MVCSLFGKVFDSDAFKIGMFVEGVFKQNEAFPTVSSRISDSSLYIDVSTAGITTVVGEGDVSGNFVAFKRSVGNIFYGFKYVSPRDAIGTDGAEDIVVADIFYFLGEVLYLLLSLVDFLGDALELLLLVFLTEGIVFVFYDAGSESFCAGKD